MYKAVDVYLERKSSRQYVGRLKKIGKKFTFEYSEAYQYSKNAMSFGPDLPIDKREHFSLKLFPSFADRIPSRENPAYREYCQSVGISPSEKNPFVLLAKLGQKGPSSFFITPVFEESSFSSENLKRFREEELKLSMEEFSKLFDVSIASVYRIENHKMSGKQILKKISVYRDSPQMALNKIRDTGHKINDQKRQFIEEFFRRNLLSKRQKVLFRPFTVNSKDIKECSPQQITDLMKYLLLSECFAYGIPQGSLHISDNISASDGGQDGLVEWKEGPSRTDYFPARYNCFQIKATPMPPEKCKKEIFDKNNELKPAIKEIIQKKGAYILCSTHEVAGINVSKRESAVKETIKEKVFRGHNIEVKFYDANRIANWVNCFPNIAIWFLEEVCGKSIGPWRSWLEWNRNLDHQSQFMSHSELDKKRKIIRNTLSKSGGVIHLSGAGGLGKTRLALEAFRPTYKPFEYSNKPVDYQKKEEDFSPLVLYSSAKELKEFSLRELQFFRVILIVDDCSLEEVESFHKIAIQEGVKFSLLTIGNEGTAKGVSHIIRKKSKQVEKHLIELEPDEDIVKKILSGSQNITNKYVDSKYLQLTSGFPLMAKLLKEVGPLNLLKDDIPTIRKKMLWGLKKPDKEGEKVIKACSLFDTIGFPNEETSIRSHSMDRGEQEAKYIAGKICRLDYDKFYETIKYFKKRQIVQQHGRFIQVRPKPLASWLAGELLENTPPESVTKWFADIKSSQELHKPDSSEQKLYSDTEKKALINNLKESFCKQLSYLGSFSSAQNLAEQLCNKGGLFDSEDTFHTNWGLRCFMHLAEVNPVVVLQTLGRIFKNTQALRKLISNQLYRPSGQVCFPLELILTLQKLAVKKELYPKSARLLLKFAEAEEINNWRATATGVFTDHFQLYLSGTEASPDIKFQIIDEIQKAQSVKQKEIAIKALNEALKPMERCIRSSDIVETKSGKAYKDWRPKTDNEIWEYYKKALKYLIQFIKKDQSQKIKDKAHECIVNCLNHLLRQGLYDDVETAIKAIVSVYSTPQPLITSKLLLFLKYHSKDIKSQYVEQIQKILNLLQPEGDLKGRIKIYITECCWFYMYDGTQEEKPEYKQKFNLLLKDFKYHLENESKVIIESSLKILFHGKQENTAKFSWELAELLKNPLGFSAQLLEFISKWKNNEDFNTSFLSGFLGGLNKTSSEKTKQILDKIASDTDLMDFIIPAYSYLKLKDHDIKRLIGIIDNLNLKSDELRSLAIGGKCQSVSPEVIGQLIQMLAKKGLSFSWNALEIYNYYKYKSNPDQKSKLRPILYDLLTQDKLLSGKERYGSMDDYYYEKAVNDLLDSDYGENFSKKFISQVMQSKMFVLDFPIALETLRKCLKKIVRKYPDMVFSAIVNNKDNSNMEPLFNTRTSIGDPVNKYQTNPLSVLSKEHLKKWCEKASDKIPAFLAGNMHLFLYNRDKGYQSWSPFTRFLFNEYGDKKDITDAISRNISQFSWAGNLSDYFERVKKPMEELRDHKCQNVRDFVEREISYLNRMIKYEKQRENERGEFGIW